MIFENSHILTNQNFLTWISAPTQAKGVHLNSLVLTFDIPKDSNSASMTREVDGVWWTPEDQNLLESTQIYGAYVTGQAPIFEALIPEPSTATLSLLALAGLCTRRRRR